VVRHAASRCTPPLSQHSCTHCVVVCSLDCHLSSLWDAGVCEQRRFLCFSVPQNSRMRFGLRAHRQSARGVRLHLPFSPSSPFMLAMTPIDDSAYVVAPLCGAAVAAGDPVEATRAGPVSTRRSAP
jgi:hypothetical protein